MGEPELRQFLGELSRGIRSVFDEQETPDQKQQRYRDMARQSIQASCGDPPKFDFKKLWADYNRDKKQ